MGLPPLLPFAERNKTSGVGDGPTSRTATAALCSGSRCLRNPGCQQHRCFLAACRPLAQFCPNCICQPQFSGWYLGCSQQRPSLLGEIFALLCGKGITKYAPHGALREAQRPKKLNFCLSSVLPGLLHAPCGLWGGVLGCGFGEFSDVAMAIEYPAPVHANLAACPPCVPARGPAAAFLRSLFLPVTPLL